MVKTGALFMLSCGSAGASRVPVVALGAERIETIPVHTYKKDCWQKRSVSPSFLQNPGAGIDKFEPFVTVEKDGFMATDCVKDYMFTHGDKFGDNKHEYKLGDVSGVSIVHYAAHVPKEDRQPMTQEVCFEFCRTVPEMNFFGILNGRECYCAPYFKPMAGDSSMCDAVCEGSPTTMCGGKSKSSIFSMHMCASTEEDLSQSVGKAGDVATELGEKSGEATKVGNAMQTAGDAGQKLFGKDGNPGASDLHQSAKVFAGKVLHAADSATAAQKSLETGSASAKEIKDFTNPADVTKAERLMETLEEDVVKGEDAAEKLDSLVASASPSGDAGDAAKQYYNVMYFVDKEFQDVATTCTGDAAAEPMVGATMDECAAHCDAQGVGNCVGFSHFNTGDESLCFLFKNFKTATYYTKCAKQERAFLQAKKPSKGAKQNAPSGPNVQCVAKLSEFEGTTLKPDGSGKCKQCLKEATKAARCYE